MSAPPGLQRERTMLAWERTVLSTVVVALALGRVWLPWSPPAALMSCVAAAAVILAAVRRRRAVAVGSATAGVALAVVIVGAAQLVLLFHRP